jgi:hypothetical protein
MISKEDRETGTVNPQVYKQYLLFFGSIAIVLGVAFAYTMEAVGRTLTDVWLSNWSEASRDTENQPSVRYYLGIYFGLGFVVCIIVYTRALSTFLRALTAAKNLHDAMLSRGNNLGYYCYKIVLEILSQSCNNPSDLTILL